MERLVIVAAERRLIRPRAGNTLRTGLDRVSRPIRGVLRYLPLATGMSWLLAGTALAYPDAKSTIPDSPGQSAGLTTVPRLSASNSGKGTSRTPVRPRPPAVLNPKPVGPLQPSPSLAAAAAVPAASPARNLKRFKVRDDYGRLVAARWYGEDRGKTALILPDGQLGIADTLVPTKDPFTPLTGEELRGLLQDGPYAGFQVVTSPHYLIFYKSTLTFAKTARGCSKVFIGG